MYDFYPEWGPARNREDDTSNAVRRPRYWQPDDTEHRVPAMAGDHGPEAWDGSAEQPDDN